MDNVIKLPGSDKWESGYTWGKELEAKFPGQEATDFAYMYQENEIPECVAEKDLVNLTCLQVGQNEGDDWIWLVVVQEPNTRQRSNYFVMAWCDYTGWDCQSGATWFGAI